MLIDWRDPHNLANLLSLSNEELRKQYPTVKWDALRRTRSKYRIKIREGNIPMPRGERQPTPEVKNEELATLQQRVAELEGQLRNALRKGDKANDKVQEYAAALRSAVLELYADIQLQPVKPRQIPRRKARGVGQTAIVGLADWQLGKQTPTYNSDVCEERIQRLAEHTLDIIHRQRKEADVDNLHIFVLGDIVEGEGIFPGQAHQIDSSLYRQVAVNGPRILGNFIGEMTNAFNDIKVTAVIGNHGALKMKGEVNPETNMDRVLYKAVEQMWSRTPEIVFDIPDGDGERNFYAVDRIGDWGFLLVHGDQIRGGFAGFPFYGAAKKTWGWIDAIPEPFDYVFAGHWHTPTRLTLNHRTYYGMGSPESHNSYAQEQLAAVGHPTQYVGFVHPEHGIIEDHWVSLEQKESQIQKYRRIGGVVL